MSFFALLFYVTFQLSEGKLTHERSQKGKWQLRANVDKDHGSKQAVDDAINAGVYESRTFSVQGKDGNMVAIEKVRVVEEQEKDVHAISLGKKGRLGMNMSTEDRTNPNIQV